MLDPRGYITRVTTLLTTSALAGQRARTGECVERIVVLARGSDITIEDLPQFLRKEKAGPPQGTSLEAIEKELILRALHRYDWNQTHAARYLDISRKTLTYRIEKPESANYRTDGILMIDGRSLARAHGDRGCPIDGE
jgi:transcriptional regulator with PAS, ATPase and Fis domain